MASRVTLKVEGMNGESAELEVVNSLRKYSGVMDVEVDSVNKKVSLDYDPDNIIAGDLIETIKKAGYRVDLVRQ